MVLQDGVLRWTVALLLFVKVHERRDVRNACKIQQVCDESVHIKKLLKKAMFKKTCTTWERQQDLVRDEISKELVGCGSDLHNAFCFQLKAIFMVSA